MDQNNLWNLYLICVIIVLSEARTILEEAVLRKIWEIFNSEKAEIYLVGGSVRDMLMGQPLKDFDFATPLTPPKIKQILSKHKLKTHSVGWAFGTVGAIIRGREVHITTYRKKEKYTPRNRKPSVEFGESIQEDLKRRDFTINALAISAQSKLIDPYQGKSDLSQKIIRTPASPDESFEDDPLRILRAFRFQSQLGFAIEEKTNQSIPKNAFRIMFLSEERIQQEMNKLLTGEQVVKALSEMMETKVLHFFLPELIPLKNLHQESDHHHKDVWRHTLKVVENTPPEEILRWAALLHDIAKPYVKTVNEEGVHFYRHEDLGSRMAYSMLSRLKFPKKWREDISFLVAKHMRANLYISEWTDSAVKRFIREMGERLDIVLKLSRSDITSYRREKVKEKLVLLDELARRIQELKSVKEFKCPISGDEIMKKFKLSPGPFIGKIKNSLMEEILEGNLPEQATKKIYFQYISNFLETSNLQTKTSAPGKPR